MLTLRTEVKRINQNATSIVIGGVQFTACTNGLKFKVDRKFSEPSAVISAIHNKGIARKLRKALRFAGFPAFAGARRVA
jgi:hypothetical protein